MAVSPPPSVIYDSFEETPAPLQPAQEHLQSSPSLTTPVTRTLAIIKTHALAHRFDIEKRIQEASFEVRQKFYQTLHLTSPYNYYFV